jgi:hypothetical protein
MPPVSETKDAFGRIQLVRMELYILKLNKIWHATGKRCRPLVYVNRTHMTGLSLLLYPLVKILNDLCSLSTCTYTEELNVHSSTFSCLSRILPSH